LTSTGKKGPAELKEFPLNGHDGASRIDGEPEGYERVLIDANRGDHSLFVTSEEVLASWRIVENVLTEWAKSGDGLVPYPQGSGRVR
jgi:glucose-6-phosphate 1-dehydrogenase